MPPQNNVTGKYYFGDEAAKALASGDAAIEMKWEKMSKSKGNGVDPSSIIRDVGVDATRLNVLFKVAQCWLVDAPKRMSILNADVMLTGPASARTGMGRLQPARSSAMAASPGRVVGTFGATASRVLFRQQRHSSQWGCETAQSSAQDNLRSHSLHGGVLQLQRCVARKVLSPFQCVLLVSFASLNVWSQLRSLS